MKITCIKCKESITDNAKFQRYVFTMCASCKEIETEECDSTTHKPMWISIEQIEWSIKSFKFLKHDINFLIEELNKIIKEK